MTATDVPTIVGVPDHMRGPLSEFFAHDAVSLLVYGDEEAERGHDAIPYGVTSGWARTCSAAIKNGSLPVLDEYDELDDTSSLNSYAVYMVGALRHFADRAGLGDVSAETLRQEAGALLLAAEIQDHDV